MIKNKSFIYKSIYLLIVILLLFFVTGCEKSFKRIKSVKYEQMLSLDGTYYVFIYMNTCDICHMIEEDIFDYAKAARKDKNKPNLYVINRSEKENYDGLTKKCAEGEDDYSSLIGSTNYQDVKVCTSPVMLKVRSNRIINVFDTKSSILEELSK